MFQEAGAGEDDTEGFVEQLRSLRGVEVAIVFREGEKHQVRVSFRSRGEVDVNAVARGLGGGGHLSASGCTLTGDLDTVVEKVITEVRRKLPSR